MTCPSESVVKCPDMTGCKITHETQWLIIYKDNLKQTNKTNPINGDVIFHQQITKKTCCTHDYILIKYANIDVELKNLMERNKK